MLQIYEIRNLQETIIFALIMSLKIFYYEKKKLAGLSSVPGDGK